MEGNIQKTCNRCRQTLAIENFSRDASRNDGYSYACKDCSRLKSRNLYRKQKEAGTLVRRKQSRESQWAYELMKNYGITTDQYWAQFRAQGGLCKICRHPPGKKKLGVDHDHVTGKIRGLLCHTCNSAIGYAKESLGLALEMAKRTVRYLEGILPDSEDLPINQKTTG